LREKTSEQKRNRRKMAKKHKTDSVDLRGKKRGVGKNFNKKKKIVGFEGCTRLQMQRRGGGFGCRKIATKTEGEGQVKGEGKKPRPI